MEKWGFKDFGGVALFPDLPLPVSAGIDTYNVKSRMGCRGRQIDFRAFCRVSTSGLAIVVYVEYIGYIQRCRLAAWAAERFERDFLPADRIVFLNVVSRRGFLLCT